MSDLVFDILDISIQQNEYRMRIVYMGESMSFVPVKLTKQVFGLFRMVRREKCSVTLRFFRIVFLVEFLQSP
ncbi:hypothetical protein LJR290_003482 [Variovorax sp. LjRoot290]|uniref:hypothetical protein n=1 Tax=Variovorax sp. LjRoot290 TaxID=3342316 RepID=UPI003ECC693B